MATSLLKIDFVDNLQKTGGAVTLNSDINVTRTIDADSLSQGQPYEVKFAATASVDGTWSYDIDDDVLLALDLAKLKIDLDGSKVTFTQPAATVVPQAHLDSLATKYIDTWKRDLTGAVSSDLARYTVIDDIELSRDGNMMTFEIESPETKLHFKRDTK